MDNKIGLLKWGRYPSHSLSQNPGICKGIYSERESIQCILIIHTFQIAVKLANVFSEWSLFPQSRKCIMDGKIKNSPCNIHNSPV